MNTNQPNSLPRYSELLGDVFLTDAKWHGEYHEATQAWTTVKSPATTELLVEHVTGQRRLGLYPLGDHTHTERTASWLAVDIDSGDLSDLHVVKGRLEELGLCPLSVTSKSKGWHVFLLFQEPLPAVAIHNFGAAFARDLHGSLSSHYEEASIEVFPKQDGRTKGPGNFLSVPWFNMVNGSDRDLIVDRDNTPLADQLDALRKARRHALADIETAVSALGKSSETTPANEDWVTEALQGASEGTRDDTCTRLAGHFAGKGQPLQETMIFLKDWALKCTPPLDPSETEGTVRGVYDRYGGKNRKVTLASRLMAVAEEKARSFFRDELSQPFADIGEQGRAKVVRIDSGDFRDWLSHAGWNSLGQAMSDRVVRDVASTLAAKAKFDGCERSLAVRVAKQSDALLYDLGGGQAVRTIAGGWSIVDVPEPTFERFSHQRSQVQPVVGGDPFRLFDFVPITDPDEQLLLLAYLVSCLDPDNPHVVLGMTGDQGSGKSSACKVLKRLIDPSEIETLGQPRKEDDLIQIVSHHWWLCVDNLSSMSGWLSDCLCRASTGEGFAKRKLWTDQDDVVFRYKRCVAVNGIAPGCWGPDLLDRSLLFQFERIPSEKRRTEREFWDEFDRVLPDILGGLFSLAANAMSERPRVDTSRLPRMADFAVWGRAVARALKRPEADFDRAFAANIQRQNQQALDASPVAVAVLHFMQYRAEWVGTATDLLVQLALAAPAAGISPADPAWPKGANWLWPRLQEVRPNLHAEGIAVDRGKETDRFIKLEKIQRKVPSQTLAEQADLPAISVDEETEFKRGLEAQEKFCSALSDEELTELQTSVVMPIPRDEGREQA